ncbi:indole-3-glycerol-phosphate synthase [Arthrobacter sp. H5]|uniref:indole-3-glycerol-phosphate synthase n=1 Tax=Arthrobacter sp. H5 TaxID=1267973 RepID=UPI0004B5E1A3|nr:indole-3-glycerol-phosphate synthase [Arthrobacter sp. H5]
MRFIESLLGARVPLIMEVKRQSADGVDLLAGRTAAEAVALYSELDAPCISVVTGRWFGGDEPLLHEVLSLTDKPVLQKDFITRVEQVRRAADSGVSAVLLTALLLPVSGLVKLVETSLSLGVTPFVEVVNAAEALSVPNPSECIIAVNNKDIRTKEQDAANLGRSIELLPVLRNVGTPCPVSASGIETPADARRLLDAGYRGLLVGTSLLGPGGGAEWIGGLHDARL